MTYQNTTQARGTQQRGKGEFAHGGNIVLPADNATQPYLMAR
jgi:hypothetical protein